MACCLAEQCSFYKLHKQRATTNWEFLLVGYCEGQYDWLCARKRYFENMGAMAPNDVHPVGVLPPEIAAAPLLKTVTCPSL